MQLLLNSYGLVLRVKNGLFSVAAAKEHRLISPEQIKSIAVTNACMISSAAIQLATDAEIPIYFFDRIGEAKSTLRSPYFESLSTLRRKQVYFSDASEGATWVIDQFRLKTAGQLEVLRAGIRRRRKLQQTLNPAITILEKGLEELRTKNQEPTATWAAQLRAWEGNIARQYWQALAKILPQPWQFSKRSRRPAQDPYNALTNYAYGMLYTVVEQALFAAGLDPHLGILHSDQYDRPTLAYDLIEAFRPWVDGMLVAWFFTGDLNNDFFEQTAEGYFLNTLGKAQFIPHFNDWQQQKIRWRGRQSTRQNHIYHSANELARQINRAVKRPGLLRDP